MDEQGSSANMANEMDSHANISDQNVNNVVNNSVSSDAVNQATPENQKTLSQDQINTIVKSSIQKGYNKGLKAQEQSQYSPAYESQNNSVDIESIKRSVKQEILGDFEAERQQELSNKEVNDFVESGKKLIEDAKTFSANHDDFDEKTSVINFGDNPSFVKEVAGLENSAEFLYQMADKPEKLGNLMMQLDNPATASVARAAIKKIAKQMQNNEEARELHNTPSPTSPIKPSQVNTGNGRSAHNDMLRDPDFMW